MQPWAIRTPLPRLIPSPPSSILRPSPRSSPPVARRPTIQPTQTINHNPMASQRTTTPRRHLRWTTRHRRLPQLRLQTTPTPSRVKTTLQTLLTEEGHTSLEVSDRGTRHMDKSASGTLSNTSRARRGRRTIGRDQDSRRTTLISTESLHSFLRPAITTLNMSIHQVRNIATAQTTSTTPDRITNTRPLPTTLHHTTLTRFPSTRANSSSSSTPITHTTPQQRPRHPYMRITISRSSDSTRRT